jgi:hypothetical protein
MSQKNLCTAIKIILAGLTAVAILNLIALGYSYVGVAVKDATEATDVKWRSGQIVSNLTEGLAYFRMDGNGYNNAYPSEDSAKDQTIDILLMGSSHMQANQVAADKNVCYLLNEQMPDWYTYNIGMNGHTLPICLDNLEAALEEYAPQKYVIIETMSVDMDTDEMTEVLDGTRDKIQAYTGGSYYLETYMPGLGAIWRQVSIWKRQSVTGDDSETAGENDALDETSNTSDETLTQNEMVLSELLTQSVATAEAYSCELVILYHPTLTMQKDGSVLPDTDEAAREKFADACEQSGVLFIDMTDCFLQHYEEEHILPNGFCNTSVGTGHLNEYGHAWIADQIVKTLAQN